MTIPLPEHVKTIIHTLEQAGFEAYAVGGCVRDCILGRTPDDWDITTSATPIQVKSLFRRTFDTGIQHGTITVLFDKTGYEVTTYRIDGEYEDGRHPKEVIFTPSLLEDLKRRDFTINAMAYNDSKGLIDEFDGIHDISSKTIRCVGNPDERFSEDALRIMRAVRFSAQLGYEIDVSTVNAIKSHAEDLRKISVERIQVELVKLLCSAHPERLEDLYRLGITDIILPEFDRMMRTEQNNPHHCYTVGEHTIHALEHTESERVLRLAVLLHDSGKPQVHTTDDTGIDHFYKHQIISEEITKQVLRRLKFDNDTIHKTSCLVKYHDIYIEPDKKAIRKVLALMGEELFHLLLQVKYADAMGQSEFHRDEKLDHLHTIQKLGDEIIQDKECYNLKMLKMTGSDLITAGMTPGIQIGEVLQELLDMVIEKPELNERDILMDFVQKKVSRTN